MPAENLFTFVQELGSGEERLVMAELVSARSARIVNEGAWQRSRNRSLAGGPPEPYSMLVASPSNRLVAALSVQQGSDFIDFNYIHLEGYPLRFVPVRARSSPRNLLDLIRFGVISFASQVLQRFLHLLPWNRTRMLCTAKLVAGYPVWRRA